jgi:hypothetical protein
MLEGLKSRALEQATCKKMYRDIALELPGPGQAAVQVNGVDLLLCRHDLPAVVIGIPEFISLGILPGQVFGCFSCSICGARIQR